MPVRFHLDESMPSSVASGLNQRDRDCTTSKGAGLLGASDEKQLTYAADDERVLITRDEDFLALAAQSSAHAGIVYWTQKRGPGQLVKDLDAWAGELDPALAHGRVFYL
ncbi:MAG: DUF5615 family PIN-like protein [Planctomycetota bacterium]